MADHWVYIRLDDKIGVNDRQTAALGKRGDIIDIRVADYEPSPKEKSIWAIVKVSGLSIDDIRELKEPWYNPDLETNDGNGFTFLAKRRRTLDVDNLGTIQLTKGVYNRIPLEYSIFKPKIRLKDNVDRQRFRNLTIQYNQ